MFVNLDTTFTALARLRRRSRKRSQRRRRPSSSPRRPCPRSGRSCQQRRPVQRAAPGHSGSHGLGAHRRRCARSGSGSVECVAPAQRGAPADRPVAQGLQRQRDRSRGPRPSRADDGRVRPGDRLHRAVADRLQLLEHPLQEPRERGQRGFQRGPAAARLGFRAAHGERTTRARWRTRRRTARPTRKSLHFNPYPNTAAPGQNPIECEAGNEPYIVGEQVIGNMPGDQGIVTDIQLPSQLKRGER